KLVPVPNHRSLIEYLGSSGASAELLQSPFGAVAGPHESPALHQFRQVQRLAALAGTGIPPGFTRLWIARQTDQLRTDVLQLEFAGVKFRPAKQIIITFVSQCIGNRGGLGLTQLSRERVALTRP